MFFSLRNQKKQPSAKSYMALTLHLCLTTVLSVTEVPLLCSWVKGAH